MFILEENKKILFRGKLTSDLPFFFNKHDVYYCSVEINV